MEFDPSLMRRQSSGIGNWWLSRGTSSGYGRRFADNRGYDCTASTPYYQMGEQRRGGLIGMWRRITKRSKKKKIFETNIGHGNGVVSYDPCGYMQNFDRGSARMEPENLSRSFSAQFANPAGFLQRMR